jgi:hypothetical protein
MNTSLQALKQNPGSAAFVGFSFVGLAYEEGHLFDFALGRPFVT